MQKTYLSEAFILIYITVPSIDEARKIARKLVEDKLAACVSIIPNTISTYRWQGKVEEYQEEQLLVKTRAARFDEVVEVVKKMHSFRLPEIISVNIRNASIEYLMWLDDEIK